MFYGGLLPIGKYSQAKVVKFINITDR